MKYALDELVTQLKAARIKTGLTQRSLGERVGMPQSHISKLEKGGTDPKLSSLVEMARALDLEIALIPRALIPAVQGTIRAASATNQGTSGALRPAFTLDDDDE